MDSDTAVGAGVYGHGYIVSDMTDDGLPVLPGFREMAVSHRDLVADLVARRRASGLSQHEVAERMGTSQPAVARLEAGLVDARMSTVQRYAAAVGAQLKLAFDEGNRNA
jgi:DNA-binding XRE family transcriptional regulator